MDYALIKGCWKLWVADLDEVIRGSALGVYSWRLGALVGLLIGF